MNDQYYSTVNDENIPTNILDNEFKNTMEILIAQSIGLISKNYSVIV